MNVSGWRKPQSAGDLRAEVADDVSKEIAGDDDVELARVLDDVHRQGVDIQVARIDVRVLLPDFLKSPLPKVMRKRQCIGLVAHAHAFQAILSGVLERVADDALDTFAGV